MKHIVFLLFVLLTATVCAQSQRLPLRFRADGTFKIVQFTDLHYIHNNPHAQRALIRMREVVEAERPDLVIVTGDMIFDGGICFMLTDEPINKCLITTVLPDALRADDKDVACILLFHLSNQPPHAAICPIFFRLIICASPSGFR